MKLDYTLLYLSHHISETVDTLIPTVLTYHDITVCLHGEMSYEINGKKVVLSPGDVIYFAPGDKRKRFANNDTCLNTFLSINLLGNPSAILDKHYYSNVLNLECMSIIKMIDNAFIYGEKEKIVLLTLLFTQEIKKQQQISKEDRRIVLIKNFIYNNVYQKITVEMVAKNVGYTSIYCTALFKKHTGKTLTDFINEAKISVAQNHLQYDQISLTALATKLGFSNYNYFSRCFKQIVGISPKQYLTRILHK